MHGPDRVPPHRRRTGRSARCRLRRAITAGEALGVPAWKAWREQTGLAIADGYGQTETGHLTGVRPGDNAPPGSMGRTLPGISARIVDGELHVDPATVPAFFLGYDGAAPAARRWHTGDQVREDDDGWLFFEARVDDVIITAGYRIGPAEVESTLLGHPSVASSPCSVCPTTPRRRCLRRRRAGYGSPAPPS